MSDTERQMDALVSTATAQLESLEKALHGLDQIRGRFRTDDGIITAEVDGNGALIGLWLAEAITRHPPAEVGPLITWVVQQAAQIAVAERAKVLAQLNEDFGAPVTSEHPDVELSGGVARPN